MTSSRRTAALVIALTLAGWALRLLLLHSYPLREDEAIYGVWARAAWADPWYLATWPDKPPLFLWLQTVALALFGATAPGARLVSIGASTLTIPLTAAIARRVWPVQPEHAAVAAGALMALNPFAISFAPTGYTDSLLVLWGTLALALMMRGRALGAGMALGAAIMTKQQGLLYLPLLAAMPLALPVPRQLSRMWGRLVAGLALIVLPILLWDAARWRVAPSPWDLGVRNYGALALLPLDALPARLKQWGDLLWYLAASPWAWALLVVACIGGLVTGRTRAPLVILVALWVAGFVAIHLFTTVQPWDRYLLPLAPVLAILAGGPVARLLSHARAMQMVAGVAALLVLLPPALTAARGGYPIGADHGDLQGLDDVLAWVGEQEDALLYHRVLGWQARFALYDAIAVEDVELRWFPYAVYLADNAAKAPHKARYLIESAFAPTPDVRVMLATRGLALAERQRAGALVVYEILPSAPPPACDWCRSRLHWARAQSAPMTPLP